jgi:3-deoxy-D-manno-octulosonic-acid transferase
LKERHPIYDGLGNQLHGWRAAWECFKCSAVAFVCWVPLMLLMSTLCVRVTGREKVRRLMRERGGVILALWHGTVMIPVYVMRHKNLFSLVSISRDGEIISRLLGLMGWRTVRGSTHRWGTRALRAAARVLEDGQALGVTPDGPRGPVRQVQAGTVYLASLTGCPIVPVGVGVTSCWRLKTWDRHAVPHPFSTAAVCDGEPVEVPRDADSEMIRQKVEELKQAIDRADQEAEKIAGSAQALRLHLLYNAALLVTMPIAATYYLWKALIQGKTRYGFRQQIGGYSRVKPGPPDRRPRVWVHAVSVGEAMAANPIVKEIRKQMPSAWIVVSTTTDTGQQTARKLIKEADQYIYFPLDYLWAVRRALNAVQPDIFLTVETELWPNMLHCAKQRGIKIMLANGRVSVPRPRFSAQFRLFWHWLFGRFDALAMRSPVDAQRATTLGADPQKVQVVGDSKLDQPLRALSFEDVLTLRRELHLPARDHVLLAGSTHAGEEEILLDAWTRVRQQQPQTYLVIAPRHTERVPDIERLIRERGFSCVRRTQLNGMGVWECGGVGVERSNSDSHTPTLSPDTVIIIDTVGELLKLYGIADVTFVGGSLIPRGGHNVLEPAIQGKPVLFGPYTGNFFTSVRLLMDIGIGERVRNAEELSAVMLKWLTQPDQLHATRQRAAQMLENSRGAAARAAQLVMALSEQ